MFPILILLALPLAQVGQASQPSSLQMVDTGFDRALFEVADLNAVSSPATRINDDLISKAGIIPEPTPGYTLLATVIVETDAIGSLEQIARSITESWVEPLSAAPGFQLVHAGNVRDALILARNLEAYYGDEAVYLDAARPWTTRALPSDPNFSQQWHLLNTLNPIADANVEGAWNAGFIGTGVIIGVTDGGVYATHPDLAANYNATASLAGANSNHGTSCAGIAAAVANNGQGGVGAAYGAQWSKQYFGGSGTNANAFGFRNDLNDIKTNSWGPSDNGRISYMTSAERTALETAVTSGRGGLGEVFTWAAGNGGTSDRVEYDPYASSRLTIAVGAIGDQDTRSWYNEPGSSMTVVAQSDGNNRGIYTTTGGGGYTPNFGGTSAASPLGAGVAALVLDANPALTWRDVKAVMIESARKNDFSNSNWLVNGAGYDVNVHYGFGSVDANAAVQTALTWTNLPQEQALSSGVIAVNQTIPDNDFTGISQTVNVATDIVVEAIEVKLNVSHTNIGDIFVKLISPNGVNSILARQRGDGTNNFNNFIFTSLRQWGESSLGNWTVEIHDESAGVVGTWNDFTLTVYGHAAAGPGLTLSSPTLMGGSSATFQVTNGTPSASTWMAYSVVGLGAFSIPSLNVTLGIANPQQLGSMQIADNLGAASFVVAVPSSATGRAYWMQSLQSGLVSNIINGTVQ